MMKRETASIPLVRAAIWKTSKDFATPDSNHRLQYQFSTEKTSDFDSEWPYSDPHHS